MAVGSVLLCCAIVFVAVSVKWPFRKDEIISDLEEATSSKVEIESFRETHFPHPGCLIQGLIFRRPQAGPNAPPLITISKLTVQGSFLGLFTKHVALVRADNMHAIIPPFGTGGWSQSKTPADVIVNKFVADDSILEFSRQDPKEPRVKFLIHKFLIRGLGSKGQMEFKAGVRNPEPPGEVHSTGTLGPWRDDDPRQTPISGTYTFQEANLGSLPAIAGKLASEGKYGGVLQRMEVQGSTDVLNFEVTSSGHKTNLHTRFKALVDATTGDVTLDAVGANFGRTGVISSGKVSGRPGERGKTASIDLWSRQGRIQDVFMLFITAPHSPLNGNLNFKAHVVLPPGNPSFLRKVQLQGDFGIDAAKFVNSDTQQTVDKLSERARGEKDKDEAVPERILSNLTGHVVLTNGLATFTNLSFGVPGAVARMHGTYDLVTERINLTGDLQIQAKPSAATSGVKSFLVKALDPFLKNNHPGAVVPVKITGTYTNPSYSVSSNPK